MADIWESSRPKGLGFLACLENLGRGFRQASLLPVYSMQLKSCHVKQKVDMASKKLYTEGVEVMMRFHLQEILDDRNISQRGLARLLGKKPQYVQRLAAQTEGPAITGSTIEQLCEVLDCQPGDLLTYVKEHN